MAGPWEKFQAEQQGTPEGPWVKFGSQPSTEVEELQPVEQVVPDAVSMAAGREGVPTVQPPSLEQSVREYGQAISQPSDLDREALRVGATGIKQGLGALPNLAGDIYAGSERTFSNALRSVGVPEPDFMQGVPAPSTLLRQGLDYLFQPRDYERPQTQMGQRAANVLGSGVAALTGPGSLAAPGMMLKSGLAAGVGAEIGGELGGTPGAIVGGIAGGLAPGAVSYRTNARNRIAGKYMEGVNYEDLEIARQRMEAARKQGVDLSIPQAMPRESGLDEMQEMLTRRQAGAPLTRQLEAQPGQIVQATENQMAGLKGQVRGQQEMSNIAQAEADKALQAAREARTAKVKPLYQQAGDLDPSDIKSFRMQLLREAKKHPNTETADRLRDLSKRMYTEKRVMKPDGTVEVKKIPVTNVNQLNEILGQAKSDLGRQTNTRPVADRTTAYNVGQQLSKIKSTIGEKSPEFKRAEELYAKITRETVDPLKQGPVGTIAQRSGYDPSLPASRTNLFGIFDRGTAKGGRSDILELQKGMNKTAEGRRAFADSGVSWIADKLSGAFKHEGGKISKDVASNIEKAFFETPNQMRGFNDVLDGIARSNKVNSSVLKSGFNTWAQTIKLAAKRPTSMRQVAKGEIEAAAETAAGKFASTTVLAPYRRILERVDDYVTNDAYGYVGRLLQSPEGIDTLKKLSAAKPGSFAAETAIARFNAIIAAEQAQEE